MALDAFGRLLKLKGRRRREREAANRHRARQQRDGRLARLLNVSRTCSILLWILSTLWIIASDGWTPENVISCLLPCLELVLLNTLVFNVIQVSRKYVPFLSGDLSTATRQQGPKITLFVSMSFSRRPVQLLISQNASIQQVANQLQQQHRLPILARLRHEFIFTGARYSALRPQDTLKDVGIGDLSCIHLRTHVLGGSSRPREGPSAPSSSSQFCTRTGRFPSNRADVWQPLGNGYFRCTVCPSDNSDGLAPKRISRHESTPSHQHHLRAHDRSLRDSAGPSNSQPVVSGHLRHALAQMGDPRSYVSGVQMEANSNETHEEPSWDMDMDDFEPYDPHFTPATTANLARQMERYFFDDDTSIDSDPEEVEMSGTESSSESEVVQIVNNVRRKRKVDVDHVSPWFPWPDKETCVLDILRHIPRCAFSRKQNTAIHWAMIALGLSNLPSDREMDEIDLALQEICGIRSIKQNGKLGHVFYTNDLAGIIAQEMANPRVRPHLHFYPEDAGLHLSEAWQADRWLKELDPTVATPMIRANKQDFFVHEPVLLKDHRVCMPIRWYTKRNVSGFFAKVHPMSRVSADPAAGWIVEKDITWDVRENELWFSLPSFISVFRAQNLADPRIIVGIRERGTILPWRYTDTSGHNPWRARSKGKRVMSFPIWLYCDDTSGNLSKRWNKHNSFLFTAAGLPRQQVHKESNIHFLCTSNIAPPLEMLDAVVDQLEICQNEGIWAWDAILHDMVLVVPFVMAMVGDNPMQSEFACHIGFRGKLFCRVCRVSGHGEDEETETPRGNLNEDVSAGSESDVNSPPSQKSRRRKAESMQEMINRIQNFMNIAPLRTRQETEQELRSQFIQASMIGGKSKFKQMKTDSGVKDTFQAYFIGKILDITSKRGLSRSEKEKKVSDLKATFPENITSPVWRIKDFDPHSDTPVEILHVVLLGFGKYLWRDAVTRVKKDSESERLLITRLTSLNVGGLECDRLSGETLVSYAGSLTGRDFRKIVQIAPFVLFDLLPRENIETWVALGHLAALVWQPATDNIQKHLKDMSDAIDHFLKCVCRLTPQWFNKPKFHVLLHLPTHVRRFGPAIIFATEGFESFNAIIRSASVHSNRSAPSKDIAMRMAKGNRVRHLLSGGFFRLQRASHDTTEHSELCRTTTSDWFCIGQNPRSLLSCQNFGTQLLGFEEEEQHSTRTSQIGWSEVIKGSLQLNGHISEGLCGKLGQTTTLSRTLSHSLFTGSSPDTKCYTPMTVTLANGDTCHRSDWILWESTGELKIAQVAEIIQIHGSPASLNGKADWIVLDTAEIGSVHPRYGMYRVALNGHRIKISALETRCTVNVQHNCRDNNCYEGEVDEQIREERHKTDKKKKGIIHSGINDYILNTAQMRDASVLASFRAVPAALDQSSIIMSSVKAIFDQRKRAARRQAQSVSDSRTISSSSPQRSFTPPDPAPQDIESSSLGPSPSITSRSDVHGSAEHRQSQPISQSIGAGGSSAQGSLLRRTLERQGLHLHRASR